MQEDNEKIFSEDKFKILIPIVFTEIPEQGLELHCSESPIHATISVQISSTEGGVKAQILNGQKVLDEKESKNDKIELFSKNESQERCTLKITNSPVKIKSKVSIHGSDWS
jgi:hypothetical protein